MTQHNDPVVVSFSELASYRRCPLKHHLEYVERWTKPPTPGGALERGTLWHEVLETHYATKKAVEAAEPRTDPRRLQNEILSAARAAVEPLLINLTTGEMTETQELVEWMYRGYVEMYGSDPQWKILGVEERVEAQLPVVDPSLPIRLKAKMDLVVWNRATGTTWIVDHKSGKDLPRDKELDIDDQFGLYTWLWNKTNPDDPVMGSIHSASRTYRLKTREVALHERFGRTLMNRTPVELDAIAQDAALAATESRQGSVYSSPDPQRCKWDCSFLEPHMLARKGRDLRQVVNEYGFTQNFERH